MNLLIIGIYYVCYQRQGNDKNSNPIYLINVFKTVKDDGKEVFYSVNYRQKKKLDKYGNIKITSYNIDDTINRIISEIECYYV